MANQQRRVLARALEDLHENDRLALCYRYFFDLPEGEMVAALGWARGTVGNRLAGALGRYRQRLGELALQPVGAFALPHVARALAGLDPAELEGALSDLGAHLPALPPHDLVRALMERLYALRATR